MATVPDGLQMLYSVIEAIKNIRAFYHEVLRHLHHQDDLKYRDQCYRECFKDTGEGPSTPLNQAKRLVYVGLCLRALNLTMTADRIHIPKDTASQAGILLLGCIVFHALPMEWEHLNQLYAAIVEIRNLVHQTDNQYEDIPYEEWVKEDIGLLELTQRAFIQYECCWAGTMDFYSKHPFIKQLLDLPTDTWCRPCNETILVLFAHAHTQDIVSCHKRMLASLAITITSKSLEESPNLQNLQRLRGCVVNTAKNTTVEILFMSGQKTEMSKSQMKTWDLFEQNFLENNSPRKFIINADYRPKEKRACCEVQMEEYMTNHKETLSMLSNANKVTARLLLEQSPCKACKEIVVPRMREDFKSLPKKSWQLQIFQLMPYQSYEPNNPRIMQRLLASCGIPTPFQEVINGYCPNCDKVHLVFLRRLSNNALLRVENVPLECLYCRENCHETPCIFTNMSSIFLYVNYEKIQEMVKRW